MASVEMTMVVSLSFIIPFCWTSGIFLLTDYILDEDKLKLYQKCWMTCLFNLFICLPLFNYLAEKCVTVYIAPLEWTDMLLMVSVFLGIFECTFYLTHRLLH